MGAWVLINGSWYDSGDDDPGEPCSQKMYGPPRPCKALGRNNDDSCVNVSSLSRVDCYFQFDEVRS